MDFEYFVLDIGVLNAYTAEEFAKCDRQFLVCSLSRWKKTHTLERIDDFIKKNYIQGEYVTVLSYVDMKKSKLRISSKHTCGYQAIPFLNNPFQLATHQLAFFDRLLERS